MFLTSFVGAILKNMEWPVVGESTSPTKLLNVEYVSDPVQFTSCKGLIGGVKYLITDEKRVTSWLECHLAAATWRLFAFQKTFNIKSKATLPKFWQEPYSNRIEKATAKIGRVSHLGHFKI